MADAEVTKADPAGGGVMYDELQQGPCVFCRRIANGEYDDADEYAVAFEPRHPVVEGRHILVVPRRHARDVGVDPEGAGRALVLAAKIARKRGLAFNLITSAGEVATQSIGHTHWHILFRDPDDGLILPWTAQQQLEAGPTRDEMMASLTELITQTVPQDVTDMLTAAIQQRDEAIQVAAEQRAELAEAQRSAKFWQGQAERWEREHQNTVLPYTTKIENERDALKTRVVNAQQACADAVENATTLEATRLPTRVLALLADPGTVHEVEVDDQGEAGDCIDDCVGCATDRGETPEPVEQPLEATS